MRGTRFCQGTLGISRQRGGAQRAPSFIRSIPKRVGSYLKDLCRGFGLKYLGHRRIKRNRHACAYCEPCGRIYSKWAGLLVDLHKGLPLSCGKRDVRDHPA